MQFVLFSTSIFLFKSISGQSSWFYTFDTAKISKCINLANEHRGTFRNTTTLLPEGMGPVYLTKHVIDSHPGKSGPIECAYVDENSPRRLFFYQKADSVLITLETVNWAEPGGALYGNAVLTVKGKVVLITTWTEGVAFGSYWRIHSWNQERYKLTNLDPKVLVFTKGGQPSGLQKVAIQTIDAAMNFTVGVSIDSSQLISDEIYHLLGKNYDGSDDFRVVFSDDASDIKLGANDKDTTYLIIFDGAHKTWGLSKVWLAKPSMVTTTTADGFEMHSNPDFDLGRDRKEVEIINRDEKLRLLKHYFL